MSDVAVEYIELGLRLGRHVDGLVDSYYGPAEIQERTDTEEPRDPTSLVEDAARLRESLDGLEEQRRNWLKAQLSGLETFARKLAGEELSFEEEVERCYGIRPIRAPESEFEAAHRELDAILPGNGSLEERYRAWREEDVIPADHLADVVRQLAEELSTRTADAVGLPEGETVEFEYVGDRPWAAFNYYLGGLQSRVSVNTDLGMTPDFVMHLIAHETYPGHHVEHAWKEHELMVARGQVEESIVLIPTPQSIISEGIAELGMEIVLGDEQQELTDAFVSGTGVNYDAEISRRALEARQPLGRVGTNAAFMLHVDGASVDEAREYVMRWALTSEKRATTIVNFITDPMWRSYASTYQDGYGLCNEFVAGDTGRFKRLLMEQLTPAELR
jgi:hypothetical protein